MRVGVIRGDLPGPLFLADLESTSQLDLPTEPVGQTRYIARPTAVTLGTAMALAAFAGFASTGNCTLPMTINGGNQTLLAKISAVASYSTIAIPTGVYATLADLIAAANPVLSAYGMALKVSPTNSARLVLYSLVGGPGSYISIDTVAHGSSFNGATAGAFGAGGGTFTVPTAAAALAALSPVGGPIDVSAATIRTQMGPALSAAQVAQVADAIAPQFAETDVAIKCFQVGNLSKYCSASYTPDPNRLPALATGAAVAVVADDGVTAFVAPVPTLSNAQANTPGAGQITLTGTGLAGAGSPNAEVEATLVRFLKPGTNETLKPLSQHAIVAAGGTVSSTSIVIPAALVPAGVVAGYVVQVIYTSLASTHFTLV
jgi:hypothetical protein